MKIGGANFKQFELFFKKIRNIFILRIKKISSTNRKKIGEAAKQARVFANAKRTPLKRDSTIWNK